MMPDTPVFALPQDAVHLWTMPVSASPGVLAALEATLDGQECQRAARFRFPHLRESFVVTHGVLRVLLGRYLGVAPQAIAFTYGERGKPSLASDANAASPSLPDLHFNLTHTEGAAAVALARGCPVGVDLEHIRPVVDADEIAARFFCAEEAAELRSLPAADRERAFFACWTRKEAYIKAVGDGLSCPLDAFRVSLRPGERPRLLHIGGDATAAAAWSLHDLAFDPGYAAALAYRDRERPIFVRDAGFLVGEDVSTSPQA